MSRERVILWQGEGNARCGAVVGELFRMPTCCVEGNCFIEYRRDAETLKTFLRHGLNLEAQKGWDDQVISNFGMERWFSETSAWLEKVHAYEKEAEAENE